MSTTDCNGSTDGATVTLTREQRDALHRKIRNYALSEAATGDFQMCLERRGGGAEARRRWGEMACASCILDRIGWDRLDDRDVFEFDVDADRDGWVRWRLREPRWSLRTMRR